MLTAISWRMRWVLLGVVGLWPFVFASTISAAPILQMGLDPRLQRGKSRPYGPNVTRHRGYNGQYFFERRINCSEARFEKILAEAEAAASQGIGPKVIGKNYDPQTFMGRIDYDDLSWFNDFYEPISSGTLDDLDKIHNYYNFDSTAAKSIREKVLNVIRRNPDKKIFWRLVDTQDGARFEVYNLGASPRQLTKEEQLLDLVINENNPWLDPDKSIRAVHRQISEKLGLFDDLPPVCPEASPLYESNPVTLAKRDYLVGEGSYSDVRSWRISRERPLIDISEMGPSQHKWSLFEDTAPSPNRLDYSGPPRLKPWGSHQTGFAQALRAFGWLGFVYECKNGTIDTDNSILFGEASNAVWDKFKKHAMGNLGTLGYNAESFGELSPSDQQDIRTKWLTTFLMNQNNKDAFNNLDAFEQQKIRALADQWIPSNLDQ